MRSTCYASRHAGDHTVESEFSTVVYYHLSVPYLIGRLLDLIAKMANDTSPEQAWRGSESQCAG
jgi:hypothetical protein